MADRALELRRWDDVPPMVFSARRTFESDGQWTASTARCCILASAVWPAETFGKLDDPDLELACVQAYNDWLIEEWADVQPRFVPQCIVPIWPMERTVAEIERAVAKGHKGVIYPASPMELRARAAYQRAGLRSALGRLPGSRRAALLPRRRRRPRFRCVRATHFRLAVAAAFSGVVRSGQFDCGAGEFSAFARPAPLSQAENRVRRKLARLGRLRNRVRRIISRTPTVCPSEGYPLKPSELVPAPVLFHLLVRSHESCGCAAISAAQIFCGRAIFRWRHRAGPIPSSALSAELCRCAGSQEKRQIQWENAAKLYSL